MDEYRLHIEGYTPESIPMKRLARLMSELATLMGSTEAVHFETVEEGSVSVASRVEPVAAQNVRARVMAVRRGEGPQEALRARDQIEKQLSRHGKSGRLYLGQADQKVEVLRFAGQSAQSQRIGPVREQGELQGQLVRIGGTDETISITLRDGEHLISHVYTRDHALARDLAHHLFGETVRLTGRGRWTRNEEGRWELDDFIVADFRVLDERTLLEAREDLRHAPRSGWAELDDPHGALNRLRYGPGEPH